MLHFIVAIYFVLVVKAGIILLSVILSLYIADLLTYILT